MIALQLWDLHLRRLKKKATNNVVKLYSMKSRYKIVLSVNVKAVNHICYPLLAYTQVKGSKPSSPSRLE